MTGLGRSAVRRVSARHVAVVLAALACCACASPEVAPDPYAALAAEAVARAADGFEADALADGVISESEYVEGHSRWQECMTTVFPSDSGVEVLLDLKQNGTYQYAVNVSPEAAAAIDPNQISIVQEQCMQGTIGRIAQLYNDALTNPEGKSHQELVFDCLAESGGVEPGTTVEDFVAEWEAHDAELQAGATEGWFAEQPEVRDCVTEVIGE